MPVRAPLALLEAVHPTVWALPHSARSVDLTLVVLSSFELFDDSCDRLRRLPRGLYGPNELIKNRPHEAGVIVRAPFTRA